MIVLGINTATPFTAITFVEDDKVFVDKVWPSHHDEAEKGLPQLADCMGLVSQVDGIVVVQGPGSFTGLRIGITIANTFAFAKKIPLYPINTFVYLWKRVPAGLQSSTAIVMRAGGDNLVVILPSTFESTHGELFKDKFLHENIERISLNELHSFLVQHVDVKYLVGDLAPEQRAKIALPQQLTWLSEDDLLPWSTLVQQCIPLIKDKVLLPQVQVEPYYLTPPHITKSKKIVG